MKLEYTRTIEAGDSVSLTYAADVHFEVLAVEGEAAVVCDADGNECRVPVYHLMRDLPAGGVQN